MHLARVRLAAAAAAALVAAAPGMALATAEPGEPFVKCQQSNEGGTDTDTCVGNPDVAGGSSDRPHVRVGFCFGFGPISGDCGD